MTLHTVALNTYVVRSCELWETSLFVCMFWLLFVTQVDSISILDQVKTQLIQEIIPQSTKSQISSSVEQLPNSNTNGSLVVLIEDPCLNFRGFDYVTC